MRTSTCHECKPKAKVGLPSQRLFPSGARVCGAMLVQRHHRPQRAHAEQCWLLPALRTPQPKPEVQTCTEPLTGDCAQTSHKDITETQSSVTAQASTQHTPTTTPTKQH